MNEPMQTTLDGNDEPYSKTVPVEPSLSSELKVTFHIDGTTSWYLDMDECDPGGFYQFTTAGEIADHIKKEYKSNVHRFLSDWDLQPELEVHVEVHDPKTNKRTVEKVY